MLRYLIGERSPAFIWRPEVREVVEQIGMWADAISYNSSVCVNGEESVDHIVAE
jgi:hypothetical protein